MPDLLLGWRVQQQAPTLKRFAESVKICSEKEWQAVRAFAGGSRGKSVEGPKRNDSGGLAQGGVRGGGWMGGVIDLNADLQHRMTP